jgi:hypothetical protein
MIAISPTVLFAIKGETEKNVLAVLAMSSEPMQRKNIAASLPVQTSGKHPL